MNAPAPLVLRAAKPYSRLDIFLCESIPDLTRSRAQGLIGKGHVTLAGKIGKASQRVPQGTEVSVVFPTVVTPAKLEPENIPLEILFEDDHVLVVNKAAGIVVHPAHGNWRGTLVQALLHHTRGNLGKGQFSIGGELRPGIVHRIDKETSGALIVAKSDLAFQLLANQFKQHDLDRRYLALVWGTPPASGSWEGPIGRDPKHRQRMAINSKGKPARTHFKRLATFGCAALLELELHTGRTHQIRVHAATAGFPLIGDQLYGNATRSARKSREANQTKLQKLAPALPARIQELTKAGQRQMLHAFFLSVQIPQRKEALVVECAPPADFREVLELLESLVLARKKHG